MKDEIPAGRRCSPNGGALAIHVGHGGTTLLLSPGGRPARDEPARWVGSFCSEGATLFSTSDAGVGRYPVVDRFLGEG